MILSSLFRSVVAIALFSSPLLTFAQNPTVAGIASIGSTHIDVTFSQAMGISALTASHYALSGSGKGTLSANPDSVDLQSGSTYRLAWLSGDMKDHSSISITVTGATDASGNPMGSPNSATLPTGGIGTPPIVASIAAVDSLHIDVAFSEPMDSSALIVGKYSLSGSGQGSLNAKPDSVAFQGGNLYRLAWNAGDMLNGADITITATGTTDAAGNSQSGASAATHPGGAIGTLPTVASIAVIDGQHIDVTFSEAMDNASGLLNEGSYALSGTGRGTLSPSPNSVSTQGPNSYRLAWTSGDMINGGDITIAVSTGSDLVGNTISSPNSGTQAGAAIGSLPAVSVLTVDDASRMSVTFSELMGAGVANPANYTLSGGGIGSFSVHPDSVSLRSNSTYRLNWNSGEMVNGGDITIDVANVFDVAGNPMGATNSATVIGGGIGTLPAILSRSPLAGATFKTIPSVQISFTEPVSGVVAASLSVNGSLATGLSGSGAGPYTFTGYAAPVNGPVSFVLATGAIQDTVGNLFAGDSWGATSDLSPPLIQSRFPADAGAANALGSVQTTFAEPVVGVAAADLSVNGNAATGIAGSGAGPYIFTGFPVPADGTINLTLSAGATQDLVGNAFAGDSWSFTLDSVPPVSTASTLHATRVGTTTLAVAFATNDDLSGVASTSLYVKPPASGTFVDSGLTKSGTGGSFAYTATAGNGLYQFASRATDAAGNSESIPVAVDASVLLNTVINGPFTQTAVTGNESLLFPMTNELNTTITLSGATPGAQFTVSRTTPVRAQLPLDFTSPAKMLNEKLNISAGGLIFLGSATIQWAFDPANLPAGAMNAAWEYNGPSLIRVYSPTPTAGNVLTIRYIQGFSEWFAGDALAGPKNAARAWSLYP